jgi:hypothetical protein
MTKIPTLETVPFCSSSKMGSLIRCNSNRCEKELIVEEADAPFECKEKGCKSTLSDVLNPVWPLLFVVKKNSLSLVCMKDGKAVFEKLRSQSSKAPFFIIEDANKVVDWLVETKQGVRRDYSIEPADWDRGSTITVFRFKS